MFILNCTQAFNAHIAPSINEPPDQVIKTIYNPMQWVLHVFQAKRKYCVVAMHDMSRYSILFVDVKKQDTKSFFVLFLQRLLSEMSCLCQLDEAQLKSMLDKLTDHTKFTLCQNSNRSVQTHISDVIWHFKNQINKADRLPQNDDEIFASGCFVNSLLRKTHQDRDYFVPEDRMIKFWNESFVDHETTKTETMPLPSIIQNNKIISLSEFRKNKGPEKNR